MLFFQCDCAFSIVHFKFFRMLSTMHVILLHSLKSECVDFSRYFGCGLPFPTKLGGCRVLDLGSGSGRDCFAFSKLVGESGYVIGIDMTEELVMRETCLHSVGIVDCRFQCVS